jgi:hypothetical protein
MGGDLGKLAGTCSTCPKELDGVHIPMQELREGPCYTAITLQCSSNSVMGPPSYRNPVEGAFALLETTNQYPRNWIPSLGMANLHQHLSKGRGPREQIKRGRRTIIHIKNTCYLHNFHGKSSFPFSWTLGLDK